MTDTADQSAKILAVLEIMDSEADVLISRDDMGYIVKLSAPDLELLVSARQAVRFVRGEILVHSNEPRWPWRDGTLDFDIWSWKFFCREFESDCQVPYARSEYEPITA